MKKIDEKIHDLVKKIKTETFSDFFNDYDNLGDFQVSDRPYNTNIPYTLEQEEVPTDPSLPQQPPVDDASGMQDPSLQGGMVGTDQYGNPLPTGEAEIQDPEVLGKVYELKKIYSRLTDASDLLEGITDPEIIQLKRYTEETIELYQLLLSNVEKFENQLDDIIIHFYNFILRIYEELTNYYQKEKRRDKAEAK